MVYSKYVYPGKAGCTLAMICIISRIDSIGDFIHTPAGTVSSFFGEKGKQEVEETGLNYHLSGERKKLSVALIEFTAVL